MRSFLLVILFGLNVNAATGLREVLLVGNGVAGTVSVIDEKTLKNLGTVNVFPDKQERLDEIHANIARSVRYAVLKKVQAISHFEPDEGNRFVDDIFTSLDGSVLYVSRANIGDIVAFDLTKSGFPMIWRTPISGEKADHAAISPDGSQIVISASSSTIAQILEAKTGKVVGSFPTGMVPHQNDYSADGKRIYNSSIGLVSLPYAMRNQKGKFLLTVADATTFKVIRTYSFDRGIRPSVLSADESIFYSQFSYFNGVKKIDLKTGKIVAQAELPLSEFAQATYRSFDEYPHDSAHHGLALSGDGKRLCDAGTIDNDVSIIMTSDMKVQSTTKVGLSPYWATTSTSGTLCYISLAGENAIAVIDYNTGNQTALIPVGKFPQRNRLAKLSEGTIAMLTPQK